MIGSSEQLGKRFPRSRGQRLLPGPGAAAGTVRRRSRSAASSCAATVPPPPGGPWCGAARLGSGPGGFGQPVASPAAGLALKGDPDDDGDVLEHAGGSETRGGCWSGWEQTSCSTVSRPRASIGRWRRRRDHDEPERGRGGRRRAVDVMRTCEPRGPRGDVDVRRVDVEGCSAPLPAATEVLHFPRHRSPSSKLRT